MTGLEFTSVPRWGTADLPEAASYLAVWFGGRGRRRAAELLAGAGRRVPVRRAGFPGQWSDRTESELRMLVGGCFTGVRIILAGPEAVVMRAAAIARGLGASAEELVLIADEAEPAPGQAAPDEAARAKAAGGTAIGAIIARRVFCVDCRRAFDATSDVGDLVTCQGCGAGLFVDRRFSRPHAAYFGWPAGRKPR